MMVKKKDGSGWQEAEGAFNGSPPSGVCKIVILEKKNYAKHIETINLWVPTYLRRPSRILFDRYNFENFKRAWKKILVLGRLVQHCLLSVSSGRSRRSPSKSYAPNSRMKLIREFFILHSFMIFFSVFHPSTWYNNPSCKKFICMLF